MKFRKNSYVYYLHVLSITDNMLLTVGLACGLATINCLCQYLSASKPDSHDIIRRVIQGKCFPPSDVSVKRCNNFLIIYSVVSYLILLAVLDASCGQMVKPKKSIFKIGGTTGDVLKACQCALNLLSVSLRCSFVNCSFE